MSEHLDLYHQEEVDDCVRACVATVLQVPTDDLPYIPTSLAAEEFWERWDRALEPHGVGFVWFEFDYPVPLRRLRDEDVVTSGLWLASIGAPHVGPTARHLIVMKGRRHFHDPGQVRLSPAIIHAAGVLLPREMRDAHFGAAA